MFKHHSFDQWISWLLLVGVIAISGCATPLSSGTNTIYIVQRGDTLGEISQKTTGTKDNAQAIAHYNNIKNMNQLEIGQQLTIPSNLVRESTSQSFAGNSGMADSKTSGPGKKYSKSSTVTEGTVVGTAAGAAIGLAACGKKNRAECALLGGVVGALVGTAAGIFVDTKQSEYASTEDYYDAQIREAKQLNQALAKHNRDLRDSIRSDRRQINRLIAQYQSGRANKSQLEMLKNDIEKKRQLNSNNLKDLEKELEKQQTLLAKMQQDKSRKITLLHKQIKKTQDETTALRQSIDEMGNLTAKVGEYL